MASASRYRPVVRFLFCLLVAAAFNIGIAWWFGWRSELDGRSGSWMIIPFEQSPQAVVDTDEHTMPPPVGITVHRIDGTSMQRVLMLPLQHIQDPSSRSGMGDIWPNWATLPEQRALGAGSIEYVAAGWPMRSMWCEVSGMGNDVHGGIGLKRMDLPGTYSVSRRVLPLRPLWRGFAVNMLVLSAPILFMSFVPRLIVRIRRRRRGWCLACGYDLRAIHSARCPECGVSSLTSAEAG